MVNLMKRRKMSSMKRLHVSWLTGTRLLARSLASIQPMKRLAADGAEDLLEVVVFKAKDVTGEYMVGDVRYSLCRWDVSLWHAVEMEPEFREEVLVGYVCVRRSWWGMLV